MEFNLLLIGGLTGAENRLITDVIKVKAYLTNGAVEVLEKHQSLLGKIEDNIIEVESNFQNREKKEIFVLKNAVFQISDEENRTSVITFTQDYREITEKTSIEAIQEEIEKKGKLLEASQSSLNSLLLEKEIFFLKKVISVTKDYKALGFN